MPLFKRDHTPPPPVQAPVEEKRGLFGRRSHDQAAAPVQTQAPVEEKRGLFGRRSHEQAVTPASGSVHSSRTGSINQNQNQNHLHNNHVATNGQSTHANGGGAFGGGGIGSFLRRDKGEDPSIAAARERVLSAEGAEREADKALVGAREAVREAREHVLRLEKEAEEEARLAKIKQTQARSISERARPLGRHG